MFTHKSTVEYIQSKEIKCCKQHAMIATRNASSVLHRWLMHHNLLQDFSMLFKRRYKCLLYMHSLKQPHHTVIVVSLKCRAHDSAVITHEPQGMLSAYIHVCLVSVPLLALRSPHASWIILMYTLIACKKSSTYCTTTSRMLIAPIVSMVLPHTRLRRLFSVLSLEIKWQSSAFMQHDVAPWDSARSLYKA